MSNYSQFVGIPIVKEDTTTSSATWYPIFVSSTTTEPITAARTASTKLTFVPNTGEMKATLFTATSDARQKHDINTIQNATGIVGQLRGVSFRWNDTNFKSYGVVAQELETVLPDLVSGTTTKSVNYDGLVGVLINAIKEMNARIQTLEATVDQLKTNQIGSTYGR